MINEILLIHPYREARNSFLRILRTNLCRCMKNEKIIAIDRRIDISASMTIENADALMSHAARWRTCCGLANMLCQKNISIILVVVSCIALISLLRFFETSLSKFGCLGTSCLSLEGKKGDGTGEEEREKEKIEEEEDIEMPEGSSIRICSFSHRCCAHCTVPYTLSTTCITHRTHTFIQPFFFLSLSLRLLFVLTHTHTHV